MGDLSSYVQSSGTKWTWMLNKECGEYWRKIRRDTRPTAEHTSLAAMKGRVFPLHSAWVFNFCSPSWLLLLLSTPPSTFTQSSSRQCTIQLIKYPLLNDIHILDLPSSDYTKSPTLIGALWGPCILQSLVLLPQMTNHIPIVCEFY